MNVYFCDVCGARVTDVDLKGGQGMRRRLDVICATCIDLGHGKAWVDRGKIRTPLPDPAPVRARSSTPSGLAPALARINVARDRARTHVDPGEPLPLEVEDAPVTAAASAPMSTPAPAARYPTPEPHPATPEAEPDRNSTARVALAANGSDLSAAASGLSALAAPAVEAAAGPTADDRADDLEEAATAATDTPVPTDHTDSGIKDAAQERKDESSAERAKAEVVDPSPEKGSPAVVRTPPPAARDSQRKSSASSGRAAAKSQKGISAKQAKPGQSQAGKSSTKVTRRVKAGNKKAMMMSLISIPLILVVGVVGIMMVKPKKKPPQTIVLTAETIAASSQNARSLANKALNGGDLAEVEKAIEASHQLQLDAEKFEQDAKAIGWSEDEVNRTLDGFRLQDVRSLSKDLRDKKARLMAQH